MADSQALAVIAESNAAGTLNKDERRFGIYRGQVIDNVDPKKTGRVKVWVPEHDYQTVKDNEGTWAYPFTIFSASNLEAKDGGVKDFGALHIPPVDSFVGVFYEGGDPSKPRYFGGFILEGAIPTENQDGGQYWNKHTITKTPKKRTILMSDDPDDECVIIRGKKR